MGLLLFLIGILTVGGIIGYKIGRRVVNREIETVHTQNYLLQQYNKHWSDVSTNRVNLIQDVAKNQSVTTETIMLTVIQLLQALQQQQVNMLNSKQQESVQRLLDQAREIASPE